MNPSFFPSSVLSPAAASARSAAAARSAVASWWSATSAGGAALGNARPRRSGISKTWAGLESFKVTFESTFSYLISGFNVNF